MLTYFLTYVVVCWACYYAYLVFSPKVESFGLDEEGLVNYRIHLGVDLVFSPILIPIHVCVSAFALFLIVLDLVFSVLAYMAWMPFYLIGKMIPLPVDEEKTNVTK